MSELPVKRGLNKKFFFRNSYITTFLHIAAMVWPNQAHKKKFYSLRGIKIGRNVVISQMVYLEESCSDLITIGNKVLIGPGVIVTTHDISKRVLDWKGEVKTGEVVIEDNVFIGAGVIILPGVTIGKNSIVAAGSVVTRDIPPNSIAMGVPAVRVSPIQEWAEKHGFEL